MPNAVDIQRLHHSYLPSRRRQEQRIALNELSFSIQRGEIFCLLGPNGSGKSTLFKILSTLLEPTSGDVNIFELNLREQRQAIRNLIGVVFQHPSLDKKLTAGENLLHQGHLYGLRGTALEQRIKEMLTKVGISERANDIIEHLSGGMQRRVELAKALLHQPQLLILDEPSTGLDPGARHDFGNYLQNLRDKDDVTILLTTHILDEAEQSDRLAILDRGNLVALGTPYELKHEIGGDIISVTASEPASLCASIKQEFGGSPQIVGGTIRIERTSGHEFIPRLIHSFPGQITSVTLAKPSLEDVFIRKTGHTFWYDKENSLS